VNKFYFYTCITRYFNPLNAELNPICYLLALLAHHFLHVSRIRVKSFCVSCKSEVHAVAGHSTGWGLWRQNTCRSLTSALDRGGWSTLPPTALPPGEWPCTHCTRGWVGLAVGLDGRVKSPPPPSPPIRFEARNVQAIKGYYTVFAIPSSCVNVLMFLTLILLTWKIR
jgi:hypothetical protein